MCNQDECFFIINRSPAANVLIKTLLWDCLQQCPIITELKSLHNCEGVVCSFRLLLRKMKHQAYFNFVFSSWLSVPSKQPACLFTDGRELCNCSSFCFPGFHVEKIKETLLFVTYHNRRLSLMFIMYHNNRLSHMQAPQRGPLGPTMVVSMASSSVGTLSSHTVNPRKPHPMPTPYILLPPAPCTFDFSIEGNNSNQVPQVTTKVIWLAHATRQSVSQLVIVIHPRSPQEASKTVT